MNLPVIQPSFVIALRGAMGMNVKQFAEYCQVTRQTVGNWETGRTEVNGPARVLFALLGEKFDV
jgi:DNA-binding transcriptional regulator YiaG